MFQFDHVQKKIDQMVMQRQFCDKSSSFNERVEASQLWPRGTLTRFDDGDFLYTNALDLRLWGGDCHQMCRISHRFILSHKTHSAQVFHSTTLMPRMTSLQIRFERTSKDVCECKDLLYYIK